MKFKQCIILMMSLICQAGCYSQENNNKQYAREEFSLTDTTYKNEINLWCNVYANKHNNDLLMVECFWDSLKTNKSSISYKEKGKYNGPCKYWNTEGMLVIEGTYSVDQKVGKWSYYFVDGSRREGNFKNGKKVGVWNDIKDGKIIKSVNHDK